MRTGFSVVQFEIATGTAPSVAPDDQRVRAVTGDDGGLAMQRTHLMLPLGVALVLEQHGFGTRVQRLGQPHRVLAIAAHLAVHLEREIVTIRQAVQLHDLVAGQLPPGPTGW